MPLYRFFVFSFSLLILFSCKTNTVYVPVETVRTEYMNRLKRDSVHIYDSVFVERLTKGDTIFMTKEKYKYLYRDKLVRDSVFITDSIQVPYPVKGDTEYVSRIYWWQTLLMALGGIWIGFIAFKIYMGARKLFNK